jgi:hypothetical protein
MVKKMGEENSQFPEEGQEPEQMGQGTQQQQRQPERPQVVTIQTPLDRPEFDWFLDQYMKKLGIQDRKQAAISLTNMFYDMGLDPYADLKDLQDSMKQMNVMLQSLPNTPAAMQVKDTLGAMYAAKTGRAMLDRMPKTTGEDAMQERMDKIMEKYLPMILTFKMMGTVMSGAEPGQPQQQKNNNEKAEIPEEFKTQMAAIQTQLAETQSLLRQQTEEKQRKEERQEIISTIHSGINPQIDALRGQVEALTSALSQKELESKQQPHASQEVLEMKQIQRDLTTAIEKLGTKEKTDQLSLSDLDTFMVTLEGLEKRLKKGETMGEFDWKSATVSTLGEIGKEAVSIFKDMQVGKTPQPQYQGPMQPTQTQSTAQRQEVIKRQVQNYIMQKVSEGKTEMNEQEAAKTLGLTLQEVDTTYQTLVAEGWIKPKGQLQQQQPQQTPQQQLQPQQPGQGGNPPVQPTDNQPFFER